MTAERDRNRNDQDSNVFDAIVVGSGFAGAVTACRLAEAGMRICILERGRRFNPSDALRHVSTRSDGIRKHPSFPVYPAEQSQNVPHDGQIDGRSTVQPSFSRMFWALGNGVWDFRDLGDVLVGQAAGYGGGSLIYANVHLRPPEHVFDARWPIKRSKLKHYFDLAAMMLNVTHLPDEHASLPKRVQLERAAEELEKHCQAPGGRNGSTTPTYFRSFSPPLAINFTEQTRASGRSLGEKEGTVVQGVCDLAGNCCLGCPQGAKNTLDFNYLHRAETASTRATVRTLAEVVGLERKGNSELFTVSYRNHIAGGAEESIHAKYVFLCAGAVNTTELLLRCRAAKTLTPTGAGLGARFYTNIDTLAAVFECEEPQELDRGPTITSSLLYDRIPDEGESAARWRIGFKGAAFAPRVGSKVTCESGGEARAAAPPYFVSGAPGEAGAIGELTLEELKGNFEVKKRLYVDGERWGEVDARQEKLRHWFLVQDGGLPVGVEPALGVFRSPLWSGRNAFREAQRPHGETDWPREPGEDDVHEPDDHAAANKRIGYATLPIEALTDLFAGLTRRAVGPQLHEASELGLQLLRQSDFELRDSSDSERWSLLPDQLDRAFRKLKRRTLDRVGLASEGVVASFVDDAAERMSEELNPALVKLGQVEEDEVAQLKIAARTLRLGIQILWGSQAGMVSAIAEDLVSRLLPADGQLMEAGVDLLKRVLDYRLGDGRTGMLLSMGLDSVPGRLELEHPFASEPVSELRGAKSGARAVVLQRSPDDGQSPKRSLIVAGMTGEFEVGEALFVDQQSVGMFDRTDELVLGPRESGSQLRLELHVVQFDAVHRTDQASAALKAPLRASLPNAIDTPERGVQERALRDIASVWGGELRTDPQWTFLRRRLTVHAQGGCPMSEDREHGVTRTTGEVYGCDGLYIMDAAAFPGPVGANPSASIAAIAEYKAEKFLKEKWLPTLTGHKDEKRVEKLKEHIAELVEEREKAKTWVTDQGRKELDPLGPGEDAKPRLQSVEPAHRPVGIEFTERMEGNLGSTGSRVIKTMLTVKIDDLAGFLARHVRDSEVRVPILAGTIEISDRPTKKRGRSAKRSGDAPGEAAGSGASLAPEPMTLDGGESYMIIMAKPGLDASGQELRSIKYHLVARDPSGSEYVLDGTKLIRDDPGFDAWEDTTTLVFELTKDAKRDDVGVLRLPASEFFGKQLRSFRADTDDPARQAWALASFARFFFGNLVDVYFPWLDKLGDLAVNTLRRGHG